MKISKFGNMEYLINLPSDYEEGKRYPVVLFLHGAGTLGDDISLVAQNPFMKALLGQDEFSFITVAPHSKWETWFDRLETLKGLVKHIALEGYTDPLRLYLIGCSMGGYGAWQLAMSMPQYFAALIPICGGGMYWNAGKLVNVPVWAFHGENDSTVLVEESIKMVDAVNKKGGNARLTVYPDTKHDAWTPTYSNKEVFRWLFSQRNQNTVALTEEYSGDSAFG